MQVGFQVLCTRAELEPNSGIRVAQKKRIISLWMSVSKLKPTSLSNLQSVWAKKSPQLRVYSTLLFDFKSAIPPFPMKPTSLSVILNIATKKKVNINFLNPGLDSSLSLGASTQRSKRVLVFLVVRNHPARLWTTFSLKYSIFCAQH